MKTGEAWEKGYKYSILPVATVLHGNGYSGTSIMQTSLVGFNLVGFFFFGGGGGGKLFPQNLKST